MTSVQTRQEVPPVIERWLALVGTGRFDELEDMLTEDAVFYSPAVFAAQNGRATTMAYLLAAEKLFFGRDTGFHYVEKWFGSDSAVLHFAAEIKGLAVEGIDMIHWNADDKITEVKVMIRPFKALQGVIATMSELLTAG